MNKKEELIDFLNRLEAENKDILSNHNLSKLLVSMKQERFDKIQPYKLDSLTSIFDKILISKNGKEVEKCRKIVILECLLSSWSDILSEKYPQSVQDRFKKNIQRILNVCQSEEGWSRQSEDVYWKDLAVARQQMFPAGARVVEIYSGFGLRQGFSINPLQSLKFLKLLADSGGRAGYYQSHTYTPALDEFNEKGWIDCCVSVAEMLEKYVEIKGLFCSSWLYDPQLERISPRLMYLQTLVLSNGGRSFYVGEDRTGNALVKSPTRNKLYREGKYKPRSYMLVWPRKELIRWGKNFKIDENQKRLQLNCAPG